MLRVYINISVNNAKTIYMTKANTKYKTQVNCITKYQIFCMILANQVNYILFIVIIKISNIIKSINPIFIFIKASIKSNVIGYFTFK